MTAERKLGDTDLVIGPDGFIHEPWDKVAAFIGREHNPYANSVAAYLHSDAFRDALARALMGAIPKDGSWVTYPVYEQIAEQTISRLLKDSEVTDG